MELPEYFDELLTNTIDLSRWKRELLDEHVDNIYAAMRADSTIGGMILGKKPQGSWAYGTIITPRPGKEFDADVMFVMREQPGWQPKTYIDELFHALRRHPIYRTKNPSRSCRCVRLTYDTAKHVDIVPFLELSDGRKVIVNRDENVWERSNPDGFIAWVEATDATADYNYRKVVRIAKFLRDRGNFTGTKSVLLTVLLGNQVQQYQKIGDPGYYSNVPTTLRHLVADLDALLQQYPVSAPSLEDPSLPGMGVTYDKRWQKDPATYPHFRDRIHTLSAQIEEAYLEPEEERSIQLWQALFGDGFKAPARSSGDGRFGTAETPASTLAGRFGRAG